MRRGWTFNIYYKIDKYFNAYDSSYSIYYGFKIVEKSIEKIIYFGDNYESILPGNEEFEAYVENINVNTHVEILQKALYEIYFSSINHIRKYILETIFKPSLIEEDNSKFFYCSFLFLSKITLPNEFSELSRRSLLSQKTIDPFWSQTMSENDREPGG